MAKETYTLYLNGDNSALWIAFYQCEGGTFPVLFNFNIPLISQPLLTHSWPGFLSGVYAFACAPSCVGVPIFMSCDVRGQPEVPSTLLNLRQGLSLPWNSLGRWADCQIPEAPFSPSPYKEDYKRAPSCPAFSNVGCSDQTQIPMIHSKHVTDRAISPDPCPGFVD